MNTILPEAPDGTSDQVSTKAGEVQSRTGIAVSSTLRPCGGIGARACFAEVTGEKVKAAHERVVARGVLPNSRISPGYARGEDGVLVVQRPKARIVVQAFKRRDQGASLVEIQAWLAENGIERSISGVASMLRSRMYLGEIHFGALHNTCAHEPIIKDRALFERVQRRTVSRGRQAKSARLLARLGVLRCGTCGSRMVINSYSGNYGSVRSTVFGRG